MRSTLIDASAGAMLPRATINGGRNCCRTCSGRARCPAACKRKRRVWGRKWGRGGERAWAWSGRRRFEQTVTDGYRRLQTVTDGYRRLRCCPRGLLMYADGAAGLPATPRLDRKADAVRVSPRLQTVTDGYRRLQTVTDGYRLSASRPVWQCTDEASKYSASHIGRQGVSGPFVTGDVTDVTAGSEKPAFLPATFCMATPPNGLTHACVPAHARSSIVTPTGRCTCQCQSGRGTARSKFTTPTA